MFIKNAGQFNTDARFQARGGNGYRYPFSVIRVIRHKDDSVL